MLWLTVHRIFLLTFLNNIDLFSGFLKIIVSLTNKIVYVWGVQHENYRWALKKLNSKADTRDLVLSLLKKIVIFVQKCVNIPNPSTHLLDTNYMSVLNQNQVLYFIWMVSFLSLT